MEAMQHGDTSDVDETTTCANGNDPLKEAQAHVNKHDSGLDKELENKPDEILKSLQDFSHVYRQDVVQSKSIGKIGMVTEVAGDSDSDSSITDDEDENDDDDEDEDDGNAGSLKESIADDNDEESADENTDLDNHESDPLPADQVRVVWMDESETTEHINDVIVVDRAFLHGDYVASASDPTGQVGVVIDVNITVDLLTHDGSVIKDIPSRDLKRVRDFAVGDYVVLGPWLGRIEDVLDNVTVQFDDGSVCKVIKADPLSLKPVGKQILEDGHFPYYPGQRVRGSSSSVFKNSRWLSGLWRANRLEGTVTKVAVGSVFIYWIASAGYGPESSTTPAEEQSPKNLKLLSYFAHAIWQLGDWCLLPSNVLQSALTLDKGLSKLELRESTNDELESVQIGDQCELEATSEELNGNGESMEIDADASVDRNNESSDNNTNPAEVSSSSGSLSVSKETVHETRPLHRKKIRKVVIRRDKKARKKEENFDRALLIVKTKTRVDVAWQDGTVERDQDSITLIPIDNPGDYEFVAEQYVVEKATDEDDDAGDVRRVGVVKSVNAKDRTACVRWLKPVSRAEDPREFDKEEVVSVYELEEHPDYDYSYGDIVVRLSPVSQMTSPVNSTVEPNQLIDENEVKQDDKNHPGPSKLAGSSTDETFTEFSNLSWVGNITGLQNGDIEVIWADGMISTVGPQAIYVVGRDDDESIAGSEASDDAVSWETVEDDEMDTIQNDEQDPTRGDASEIGLETEDSSIVAENSGRNGALAAALGFVTRLASGIFSRGGKDMDSPLTESRSEDDLQSHELAQKRNSGAESCSQKSGSIDSSGNLGTNGKEEEHDIESKDLLDVAETLCSLKPADTYPPSQSDNGSYNFKGFDITKDPYDHYFLGATGQNSAGRKWLKKVQQGWNILQNNLPDGIYVRVYEDRMDLLRVVIVGAYGTPYQDGLFFFDFHLPPEYPDVPPSAYYHSGGWRINPNLYEEGKVCLSLLNTWSGKGNEVWDPSSSSILQVLVSLQGLVLNSKPYFNEAGYDKQIGTAEGEKNSLSYNENTFLLNCKTMMYLMRKPPKDFEVLVKEHFRKRGYYILKACDAYKQGYLIGSLQKDASVSSSSASHSNSVGFKLMLAKIVPKLYVALSDIGADCEEFIHLKQV